MKKILDPGHVIRTIICISATLLLAYIFSFSKEDTPLAYFAYLYSTYALVIFIIWFIKGCSYLSRYFKNTKTYKFYIINLIMGLIMLKKSR